MKMWKDPAGRVLAALGYLYSLGTSHIIWPWSANRLRQRAPENVSRARVLRSSRDPHKEETRGEPVEAQIGRLVY